MGLGEMDLQTIFDPVLYFSHEKRFRVYNHNDQKLAIPPNIEAWRACGGTGILHHDAQETTAILKEMGILF